jgi:hypothetical protein
MSEAERADLLPRMMRANALDPDATEERHPELMLSLRAACAMCRRMERCASCLDRGVAVAEGGEFCLNAPLLKAIAKYTSSVPTRRRQRRR